MQRQSRLISVLIWTFHFFNTQCNVGEAVRRTLEYISSGKPKIMFLGPGCSKAAMPVAEAIHYWNIVQVSSLTCYVKSRINHITDILMKPGKSEDQRS